jgi:hypothetical protein
MTFALWILAAYLAVIAGLFATQRRLLYFPDTTLLAPQRYGLENAREVSLEADDGVSLTAWLLAPRSGMPVIVYFHGNAANLGNRAERFALLGGAGYGLLAPSYRGYGGSEGSPSEDGLYRDGRAALERAMREFPGAKIVLYGESLGTGVATRMATEYDVAAVILEAPYTSLAARAQEIYWWLPARLLVLDRFDNAGNIGKIGAPVAILHGERDDVVPVRHGRALLEMANAPKTGVFLPGQGHGLRLDAGLMADVSAFLRANGVP